MLDTTSAVLAGYPTCAEPCYFCLLDDSFTYSTDIRDIIRARDLAGLETIVDNTAVSHLLHDGFIPQPRTIYQDIYVISTGFTAHLDSGEVTFRQDYPFFKAKSANDEEPSAGRLLVLLANAMDEACRRGNDAVLMLSAGLDSSSLALAAKEAGRDDICCVTYAEVGQREEAEFARRLCQRLGLRHETFIMDLHSGELRSALLRYASVAPEPCADPAFIACLMQAVHFSSAGTVIIDGSGSDSYFWKPPRILDRIKLHLGLSRISAVRQLRGLVPMHMRHERLLATPLEPMLFSGPRLRHHDTRKFFPESVDTHQFWLQTYADLRYPAAEVRSGVRSTYIAPAAQMLKTRNAALTTGAIAQFPWADEDVANYCFNLPEAQRFDVKSGKSKILVRQMLRQFTDYRDDVIGKRVFSFGKRAFIAEHLGFLRDEVLKCGLWSQQIGGVFDKLSKSFQAGYRTENALLDLLMVSLWHNHWVEGSAFRQRTPKGVAA